MIPVISMCNTCAKDFCAHCMRCPYAPCRTATESGAPKLAAMDIFAGCGGLSCGMHKASAAETKWAIEYERPAAEAFK